MRTKRIIGWIALALVVISAGIATAQTDRVVKWTGGSNSVWNLTENWLDINTPGTNAIPGVSEVAHWEMSWTNGTPPEIALLRLTRQPIISGTNVVCDELRVSTAPTNVILTVNDGSLRLQRNSQNAYSIRMNTAVADLTITGNGTFIQGNTYGDSTWYVFKTAANGGDLTLDTAEFEIEDQMLTLSVKAPRTITINPGAGLCAVDLKKSSTGTLVLNGQNQWTGYTQVSGTLILGTNNAVSAESKLRMQKNSLLKPGGFDCDFNTLRVANINAVIDFENLGTSDLTFSNSSAEVWGDLAQLSIINYDEGNDSIRIGTNHTGVTADQLARITINGTNAVRDTHGYLFTQLPPPPPMHPIDTITMNSDMSLGVDSTTNGQMYQVIYKENLIYGDWLVYTNITTADTNGFTISMPTNLPAAFYRVISDGYEYY